jgi:chromosome segregation ATPase
MDVNEKLLLIENEVEDLKVDIENLEERIGDLRDMLLVLLNQLEESASHLARLTRAMDKKSL